MASANKFVSLFNGNKMPILGLGTWLSKPGEVREAVKVAVDYGYRHIDCAHVYGNEAEVGEALKEKFDANIIKREDIFITSKLWNTKHHPDDVEAACDQTLKDLQLSYVDMYLMHWPMAYKRGSNNFPKDENGKFIPEDVDYLDTFLAMENLVKNGKCKAIGLSNFSLKMMKRVVERATIQVANLQVEMHPLLNQSKLVEYCKENNITITAYSPLGAPQRPWIKDDDPKLMEDPIITGIAAKKGKSPAQVLIRFALDRGVICIPKSVTPSRIQANFEALNFELDPEDLSKLMSMHNGYRGCLLEWVDHPQHPFLGKEKDE
ncbi:aldo-keto reductase family 1 member B1-like [Lytechinus variegatus]|uniref:aldo-keto reductase family 1 member B1-like n=1 Tax=Lytechinus variegatus TaxID=7654 RepID=UPI001BB234E8|nr:aldo-keto reductase family 1 member B1-like [Lytechinus variegatus]